MNRILLLVISKIRSVFQKNIAFSARVEYSNVSKKAKIWGRSKIYHSSLGDFSYVGRNTRLAYADVGKFCSIAGDVIVGMGSHTLSYLSTSPIFTEEKNGSGHKWSSSTIIDPFHPVRVGNDVWIGTRALILGGVTIGDGAIIGAGAIVTKDVPPYAIVAGVPAKIIRYRFPCELIEKLETLKWWDLPESALRDNIGLFQSIRCEDALNSLSTL